jgi:hypothetical protein
LFGYDTNATHEHFIPNLLQVFGNPITPNMSVNRLVFGIDGPDLEKHENKAVKSLRKLLINHNDELASDIAHR